MSKAMIYKQLEDNMLKYAELKSVPVMDNGEPMVKLKQSANLQIRQLDQRMLAVTGQDIYLRERAAALLSRAAALVGKSDLQLEIVYGYRSLSIQTALYQKFKSEFKKQFSGIELEEAVHRLVAVPEVAGHPTGGAVDVQILADGKPLDFGTKIWSFEKDSYTYSPFVSGTATGNRKLLREVMRESGFAPFDGEWWHFSYGDREWAKYYSQTEAIYAQLEFGV